MRILPPLLLALALLPATATAQVPVPTPTIVPTAEPEPDPTPPPPPVVEPPPPGTETVTRGFDLAHTYYSAEPAATPPFGPVWSASFPGPVSSPLVAGGRAFASVADLSTQGAAAVVALDAASGRELWRTSLPGIPTVAFLGYGDGTVMAADMRGGLYALDAASGATRWTQKVGDHNFSPPVVAGGLVYLQGSDIVRAFDLGSGAPRFTADLGDGGDGAPAIAGDRLYAVAPCVAAAFDRRDGRPIWRLDDRGCSSGGGLPVSLHKRRVLGYNAYFLDAETGARAGERPALSVLAGDIGIGGAPGGLTAYDIETGAKLWSFVAPFKLPPGERTGAIAGADETILTRTGPLLYGIDRRTGKLTWTGRLPVEEQHGSLSAAFYQDFAIGNGVVLVPFQNELWALSANAKDPPPSVKLDRPPRSPITYGDKLRFEGKVATRGLDYPYDVSLRQNPWPFRRDRHVGTEVKTSGKFVLDVRPARNSLLRLTVNGHVAKTLPVVVLPRVSSRRLDHSPGSTGRLRVTVRVPRAVRLRGATVASYLGRGKAKRFELLGRGRLSGRRGRFTATYAFRTISGLGKKDFAAICVRGIHRRGMSFGDRLDRSCGAASVRF